MLTLEETLASQKNLGHLCAIRNFEINELFHPNAFYGNDYILKKYAGFSEKYSLKAIVPHGIYLSDTIWEAEINSPLPVIFSYPNFREQNYIEFLKEKAVNKVVIPSAAPFLYLLELLKEHPQPERKGTIFFLGHSSAHVTVQMDWEHLAEHLSNLSDEYKPITVCIYWRDLELGRHVPFQQRGIRITSAGHMLDKDFLFRFYHLCSTHRYAGGNELGSQLFFSIKSGCSYFHLDTIECFYTAETQEILNRDSHPVPLVREEALKSLFKSPKPCTTTEQMKLVDYYLGAKYLKSPEELRQQLLDAEELFNQINPSKQIFPLSHQGNELRTEEIKTISRKVTERQITLQKQILIYTDDYGIGGVAQYNHSLLHKLMENEYKLFSVQSRQENHLIAEQKQLGVEHIWLNFDTVKDFHRTLTNPFDAQSILSSIKPDLIIFSDSCPLSNFAAKQVAIALGVPYITVIGFVAPYLADRFAAYLDELSYQYTQAKEVIAVSNENLTLLYELFRLPKSKGKVIYYGRSEQYFAPSMLSVRERLRQEFDIPSNAVVCFTAARLDSVKGYQYQLEAIRQLKQSAAWNELYFVWAGAGNLETQLKDAIEQLGVSNQVKLLGQRWDVPDWLDASDIFILPSELEGMPLCIMEAMAKGLPVIASAVSGIPEELGNTGKLLTDPKVDPQSTITELVATIQAWSANSELRCSIGEACKQRAQEMFREERMVKETVEVIEHALLPVKDYVSPGFSLVLLDRCFPNMIVGDTSACPWSYLRREVPHNWYVDKQQPTVGFLSRDEAHILYNTALKFKGKKALEVGCWLGWSACHLALAGVELDVVDPLLGRPDFYESVSNSLKAASVLDSVNLIAGFSPQKVEEMAVQLNRKWSLIFIDGNHEAPSPLNDAIACEQLAEADALILFHDLASPDVAQGLDYLKQRGWNVMIYQTMQIMGVAWRGNVEPVIHQPDPKVYWQLPEHLQHYPVSGLSKDLPGEEFREIINAVRPYVANYIYQYQKDPANQSVLANLRQVRQEIANQWLSLPVDQLESAYVGKLGNIHKMLLDSGIKNETLTDAEQNFVNDMTAYISSGFDAPKAINYLLVAMLYQRADQLLLQHDITRIPHYLLNDYLKFILYAPAYFQEIGGVDRYYHYMQECLDYLYTNIFSNPNEKLWHDVALFFTYNANFIPLYFNRENLRDIYTKRAKIMEFALKSQGHQIDYEFPQRAPLRQKIRLGILAAHFGPQTETFATLPVYKHLNRDLFEIILFTLNTSNHRLERYCTGHADSLVKLPAELPSQVQTIREADLDVLFISTNVTAVTHQITLLALHRLARIQMLDANSPVTTGMRHVDYYVSSKLSELEEDAQQHYSETLVKLDSPPQCFDFATEEQLITTTSISKENLGISKNTVAYISGANFYKITPEVEAAWTKIIASVSNSVLLLYPFNPNWSSSYPSIAFQKRIAATFAKHCLGEDRFIVLHPAPNRADIKERLKLGDIYLDSYPYSGMTSLIDPVELGLPTVVIESETSRSKKGASLLKELQILDLIADNEESYINLAIALGTNPELRKQKSDQIKQRMQANPRFLDSRSYSAQMGAVFQELFRKHQAQVLTDNLKLREINLITFPDWSQPEEELYQTLVSAIASLVHHPDKNQMTLLINIGNLSEDDASLFLSEVVMNLLMEEDLDVADGPEISIVGQLSTLQWEVLLPQIKGRIVLENENKEAIAAVKAEILPAYNLNS